MHLFFLLLKGLFVVVVIEIAINVWGRDCAMGDSLLLFPPRTRYSPAARTPHCTVQQQADGRDGQLPVGVS